MFCPNCGKEIPPASAVCPFCALNMANPSFVPVPPAPAPVYGVASAGIRFVNLILDYIFFIIFAFIVGFTWGVTGLDDKYPIANMNNFLFSLSIITFYYC